MKKGSSAVMRAEELTWPLARTGVGRFGVPLAQPTISCYILEPVDTLTSTIAAGLTQVGGRMEERSQREKRKKTVQNKVLERKVGELQMSRAVVIPGWKKGREVPESRDLCLKPRWEMLLLVKL